MMLRVVQRPSYPAAPFYHANAQPFFPLFAAPPMHRQPQPAEQGPRLGFSIDHEMKVTKVVGGSACEDVLRCGDMIMKVNDQWATDMVSIANFIHNQKTTSIFNFLIRRVHTAEKAKSQVDEGLRLREDSVIKRVFDKYKDFNSDSISTNLKFALRELGISDIDMDEFIRVHDLNRSNGLSLDEFRNAVKSPSPQEIWAKSLPLAQLLGDALPKVDGIDPMRVICTMTKEEISAIVTSQADALKAVLLEEVGRLKKALKAVEEAQHDLEMQEKDDDKGAPKFSVVKMSCGTIDDFHAGLQGRVGSCHLDFEESMKAEHCTLGGNDRQFRTENYHVTTWPSREWNVVVHGADMGTENSKYGRRIPKIEELQKNADAIRANLTRVEIIAIVLYTGPMFNIYNAILRNYPVNIFQDFKAADNLFPTTIFVLASGVVKLSRGTKLPKGLRLYRGLGGTVDLPDSFFKGDDNGCRGFAEWGFLSTTTQKSVALKYSGVNEKKPVPTVLAIRIGAVDRGACIRDFSQYQEEIEYLYVPCSFLEQDGPKYFEITEQGVVTVFPVKINANLKSLTVEEQLGQKRNMHLASFTYQVNEVEVKLRAMAKNDDVSRRLQQDKTKGPNDTVESFVNRIIGQCKEVLSRHQAVGADDYANDSKFRSLELEMVDVKTMALSKFDEWVENKTYSFIRFRLGAQLRTVHRRWIAFLERRLQSCPERERQNDALRLCKVRALIADSVNEVNELGETRLMAAAAEGRSARQLRLLVEAGSEVNRGRPDGVTALWLAAQFGLLDSINALVELKADVNQAANDGATPVYIAAQSGNLECIKRLVELKANVALADKNGLTPVHQAAMNGHVDCIRDLQQLKADLKTQDLKGRQALQYAIEAGHFECVEFLKKETGEGSASAALVSVFHHTSKRKRIIISTGDISDVDGFIALAEYSKTEADVLFMMNYPAYIGIREDEVDPDWSKKNPGLGYRYSTKEVLASAEASAPEAYKKLLMRYKGESHELMKAAMTDVAFWMATRVWADGDSGKRGQLFFAIGGINQINPFSATAIKNEVLVYAPHFPMEMSPIEPKEGLTFDQAGKRCELNLEDYEEIYIDFNGSMAFFDDKWALKLADKNIASKIKGAFVMGGVYADETPITMPSIPNVLNRFSSATMNQLYHPQRTSDFLQFVSQNKIPTFTITNNVVGDLMTFDKDKNKTYDGVDLFFKNNGLDNFPFLKELASMHYNSKYNPPRKAFDFYTAKALQIYMNAGNDCKAVSNSAMQLFFSNVYGMTFVSVDDTWETTRQKYVKTIDTTERQGDNAFIKTKKEYFLMEIRIMKQEIKFLASVPVWDVKFNLSPETKALELVVTKK